MNRSVEYESLAERLGYYLLELDIKTLRYYVQPINVPVLHSSSTIEGPSYNHVPDVLFFRQGFPPTLWQIKHDSHQDSEDLRKANAACEEYCRKRDWRYEVRFPNSMDKVLERNIKFLSNFVLSRPYYASLTQSVLGILHSNALMTVETLAQTTSAMTTMDTLTIKPLIYHLIATGKINFDVQQQIGPDTNVRIEFTSHPTLDLITGGEHFGH